MANIYNSSNTGYTILSNPGVIFSGGGIESATLRSPLRASRLSAIGDLSGLQLISNYRGQIIP